MYILDIMYSSDDILSGPLSKNGSLHETNTAYCNSIKIVLYHVARHEAFFKYDCVKAKSLSLSLSLSPTYHKVSRQ